MASSLKETMDMSEDDDFVTPAVKGKVKATRRIKKRDSLKMNPVKSKNVKEIKGKGKSFKI